MMRPRFGNPVFGVAGRQVFKLASDGVDANGNASFGVVERGVLAEPPPPFLPM